MTIEELKSLRTEVQATLDNHDKLYMSTWSETCLLELIDAEIERQEPCDVCYATQNLSFTKHWDDGDFMKDEEPDFCPGCGRDLRGVE